MSNDLTPEHQFEINLLFKEKKNSIEAFQQIIGFYEVLNEFDKILARNIATGLTSEYLLDDVEFGSIKTFLTQVLKGIPDEILKDPKISKVIGYFLVKAKYLLIKKLSDEKSIDTKNQVEVIAESINSDLNDIAKQSGLFITQINNYIILNSFDELSRHVNSLKEKELLEFKSAAGNVFIQKGVNVNMPKILSELGQRTIINETKELLKLKKVDLLSDESKWDFLNGKKLLKAKVSDKEWLDSFHQRNVDIKPEDALLVTLKTTHSYSPNFDDKKTEYEILKVHEVITPENGRSEQLSIDDI